MGFDDGSEEGCLGVGAGVAADTLEPDEIVGVGSDGDDEGDAGPVCGEAVGLGC